MLIEGTGAIAVRVEQKAYKQDALMGATMLTPPEPEWCVKLVHYAWDRFFADPGQAEAGHDLAAGHDHEHLTADGLALQAIPLSALDSADVATLEPCADSAGGLAVRLAALQHTNTPSVQQVWITVFAGDHGVGHRIGVLFSEAEIAARVNVADVTFINPSTSPTGKFEITFGAIRWRPVTAAPLPRSSWPTCANLDLCQAPVLRQISARPQSRFRPKKPPTAWFSAEKWPHTSLFWPK